MGGVNKRKILQTNAIGISPGNETLEVPKKKIRKFNKWVGVQIRVRLKVIVKTR